MNGVVLQSVSPGISDDPDPAWTAAAAADGSLLVEVLLEVDPPRLTLSLDGHAETYEPAPIGVDSDCP